MRHLRLSFRYAWSYSAGRPEHFLMYRISLNAQRDQITVHIREKPRRAAQIEVGTGGNSKFLQAPQIKMSSDIKVFAEVICWIWFAIGDHRTTSGNGI